MEKWPQMMKLALLILETVPVQFHISLPPWSSVTTYVKSRCVSRLTLQPALDFH